VTTAITIVVARLIIVIVGLVAVRVVTVGVRLATIVVESRNMKWVSVVLFQNQSIFVVRRTVLAWRGLLLATRMLRLKIINSWS
jgi:hypothetical protein